MSISINKKCRKWGEDWNECWNECMCEIENDSKKDTDWHMMMMMKKRNTSAGAPLPTDDAESKT